MTLPDASCEPTSRRLIFFAAAVIAGAALVAYANTVSAPFIFDDIAAIVENPTIRDLSSLRSVLTPPSADGVTVSGRIPHLIPPNEHNRFYLETKERRSGHVLDLEKRRLEEQSDATVFGGSPRLRGPA